MYRLLMAFEVGSLHLCGLRLLEADTGKSIALVSLAGRLEIRKAVHMRIVKGVTART